MNFINLFRNSDFGFSASIAKQWLVWALPRSLATTRGIKCLSLFLWLLRCFSSPAYHPAPKEPDPPIYIGVGFPIRKSRDQSLFDNSPELIAAYHVLHRLLMSRHPPYAFCNLICSVLKPKRDFKTPTP